MDDTVKLLLAGPLRTLSLCLSLLVILLPRWWYPLDSLGEYRPEVLRQLHLYPSLLALAAGACACALILRIPIPSREKWWSLTATSLALALIVLLPANSSANVRYHAASTLCISYQRQMAQALTAYAQDHHLLLPHTLTASPLKSYLTAAAGAGEAYLECPALPGRIGYGYNSNVQDLFLVNLTQLNTLVFTADGGNDQHLLTGQSDIAQTRHDLPPREFNRQLSNPRGFAVSYADGHVAYLRAGTTVRLEP